MTIKELEQIVHIKNEIEVLYKRLGKAKGGEFAVDYAKDYTSGYGHPITISGYTLYDGEKVNAISALIEKRKNNLMQKILEAEQFIDSIPDSKMRTLLTLKYLEGMTWDEVAKNVYRKMTEGSVRKYVNKYFGEK